MENISLLDALKKAGLALTPDPTQSKQRDGSQWIFYKEVEIDGKIIQYASFGDFKSDTKGSWTGDISSLTDAQKKAYRKKITDQEGAAREMQSAFWDERKLEAQAFVANCIRQGDPTHYLIGKKLDKLYGALIHINEHGFRQLIVPMRDVDGTIWSYQTIYDIKIKLTSGKETNKLMLRGGKKEGCFHLLSVTGEIHPEGTIYVCEGFATGASIFASFGESQPVVVAFDAGNLEAVGKALRDKYPAARMIFCADDDSSGSGVNTGITAAALAAAATRGEMRRPRFGTLQEGHGYTDFNDVHQTQGLEAVKEQIENPEKFRPEGEYPAVICKGKPSELQVATVLLKEFRARVLVQEQDLFTWTGTHWHHCDYRGINAFKNAILQISAGKYGSRDVDAAYKTFLRLSPTPPPNVSMFNPHPLVAVFENGSLHLHRNSDHSYRLEFRPNNQADYQTTCMPFRFPVEPGTDGKVDLPELRKALAACRNDEFHAMLHRIWEGDPDQEGKIRLYSQNLGALLIAAFPQVFMYVGKPKTGKSTLLLIAARLVEERNRCGVDPSEFEGFHMESMINKRLNVHTDISTHRFLSDSVVKQIIDRFPFRIRRKGIKDIYGVLPPIHMFAANGLPKSLEASNNSLDRRLIIVKTERFQPVGLYDKDYHDHMFERNPAGIIAFALLGLLDLLDQKGHYTVPESGKQAMQDWKEASDPVALFLGAVERGEILHQGATLIKAPGAEIERSGLWDAFTVWHQAEFQKVSWIGRNKVMDRVEAAGYASHRYTNRRVFRGIGVVVTQSAMM